MKKAKKIAIIVAVSMIAVGLVSIVGSLAFVQFDATKLNTLDWESKTYAVEDTFTNISIQGGDATVSLVPATDGNCKVVCTENEVIYDKVEVVDNTLTIERVDESKWYNNIGVHFGEIEVTVYLPEDEYETLFIDNTSGRVDVPEDFTFTEAEVMNSSGKIDFRADVDGALKVENTSGGIYVGENTVGSLSVEGTSGSIKVISVVATGDAEINGSSGGIDISEVECANISVENSSGVMRLSEIAAKGDVNVKGTSGGMHLEDVECVNVTGSNTSGKINCTDVIASGDINLENSSGGIALEACDAANLKLEATSGSIKGILLTEKIFRADATSGSVDVPKTTSGGVCEVTTTSGSIQISIVE